MAKNKEDRKALTSEIATRAAAGLDFEGFLQVMPDPDQVLSKRGDQVDVLKDLATDDQAVMAMNQRKLGTLLKENYRLAPGTEPGMEPTPEAVKLCDDLTGDLENLDMYHLISEVLDAPYYGLSVSEILWEPADGRMKIVGVVPKPFDWFVYSTKGTLLFNAQGAPVELPKEKFVVARHYPTYDNPYGVRLLSRCLWPISFKRGGVKFWMQFAERFGCPWTIGHAPAGSDAAMRRDMAADLARMVQDAVVVLPQGAEVTIKEAHGQGLTHERLVRYWDSAISKVLMGQTLTAELNNGGSLAAAETHRDILNDYRQADGRMLKSFMEDLAWTYCRVNGGEGVVSPVWEWVDEEDGNTRAALDKKLFDIGVRFTTHYITRQYGLTEQDFILDGEQAPYRTQAGEESPAQFAQVDVLSRQEELDRLIESLDNPLSATVAKIETIVKAAADPIDMERRLMEAFDFTDDDAMVDILHRATVAAHMYGRWTAR